MKNILCICIKMYKLRDWVDETQLCETLSDNERAVEYLENHEHLIVENNIFKNENAIHIIEKRIQKDFYRLINYNKNAVNFLRNNPQYIKYDIICLYAHGIEFVDELIKNNELDKIHWGTLSGNPAAMHILNDPKYYEYIQWQTIVGNKNAVELVKNNLHMVEKYWFDICTQPHLMDIIEQNMDKVDWDGLSQNYNAIHILEKNLDKIYWNKLSENYNAIHILEQNIDKISVERLCWNKNGFQLLLRLNHAFRDDCIYNIHIVFNYFDYCEKNNIPFNLISYLSKYGYTEKHMEFLKHNNNHVYLSKNPNIFEYDYKRMRETRQALLWYNDIKK